MDSIGSFLVNKHNMRNNGGKDKIDEKVDDVYSMEVQLFIGPLKMNTLNISLRLEYKFKKHNSRTR